MAVLGIPMLLGPIIGPILGGWLIGPPAGLLDLPDQPAPRHRRRDSLRPFVLRRTSPTRELRLPAWPCCRPTPLFLYGVTSIPVRHGLRLHQRVGQRQRHDRVPAGRRLRSLSAAAHPLLDLRRSRTASSVSIITMILCVVAFFGGLLLVPLSSSRPAAESAPGRRPARGAAGHRGDADHADPGRSPSAAGRPDRARRAGASSSSASSASPRSPRPRPTPSIIAVLQRPQHGRLDDAAVHLGAEDARALVARVTARAVQTSAADLQLGRVAVISLSPPTIATPTGQARDGGDLSAP